MTFYELRYTPASDLGARYPHWVIATFRTREVAEVVVPTCPNAECIVVIEVGEFPIKQGETGRIGTTKVAPNQRQTDRGPRPQPVKDS